MLENNIAIVTGGANGLGFAIARHLFNHNAKVIIFDIDEEALRALPSDYITRTVDVTYKTEVEKEIEDIICNYGKIDILINNAGVIYSKPLFSITNPSQPIHDYSEYKKIIDINMHSVFLISSLVSATMIKKKIKGNIINISSICAQGNVGQSAYSAAKAGVNAFTKVWARELGIFGIRVNAIAPGFINTPSTHNALNPQLLEKITHQIPLRKLGEPSNVADLVLSVITNDYITGSILDVNGAISI